MVNPVVHGLYTIKDQYFEDFSRPYWVDNKHENRPYYYLLKDKDDVLWVIPLSSRTQNYAEKIRREEEKRGTGKCIYYHIAPIASVDRVFLISDMFPISEEYISGPYTIDEKHYVSRNKNMNFIVRSKAMRYLALVNQGKVTSRNDIMGIKRALLNRKGNLEYVI